MNITLSQAFLPSLKSATSQLHRQLEQTPLSTALLAGGVTKEDYAAYLKKMLGIHLYFETAVFPLAAQIITDIDARKKAASIATDLAFVAAVAAPAMDFALPAHSYNKTAYALGCLYVLEGSTLGGKFILQHITQILPYPAGAGASYFAGYGASTGSMWKAFLDQLSGFADTHPQYQEDIVQGAKDSFVSIRHYFESAA